jgi:Mce-associated membrane protein
VTRRAGMVATAVAVVLLAVVGSLVVAGIGTHALTEGRATPLPGVSPIVVARDGAVEAASTAAIALTSLDSANPDASLDRMQQASTGDLLTELTAQREQRLSSIRASGVTATGSVLAAAASEVNVQLGTAHVLVLMHVTTTRQGAQQTPSQLRMELEMTRTPQGWKASGVSEIPAA